MTTKNANTLMKERTVTNIVVMMTIHEFINDDYKHSDQKINKYNDTNNKKN